MERCEGADLAGQSCVSLGFASGALACNGNCLGFDTSSCVPAMMCGDGRLEGDEVCDGALLAGQTCEAMGLGAGALGCNSSCDGFVTSGCAAAANWGNGQLDASEVCDGTMLNQQSCESLGLGTGAVTCNASCNGFDTSGCVPPMTCGNGQLDSGESCDGALLAGQTCESLGNGPGAITCNSTCTGFDTSGCAAASTCGNRQLDAGEPCDGALLNGQTCQSRGFGPGTLTCLANCADFDTSACAAPARCGDGIVNGMDVCDGMALNGATCISQGFDAGQLGCQAGCMAFDTSACTNCQPTTCAAESADCGALGDGCGGTLSCGTCSAPLTCGGGGSDNVCGAACDPACPVGWTCDGFGLCEGGTPSQLTLNIDAVALTVSVTLNNAPYALISACTGTDDAGELQLVRSDTGASMVVKLPCDSAVPIELFVPTGSYELFVTGDGADTEIPAIRTSVGTHTINAATNLTVNVDAVTVDVSLTLNGAPYVLISACTGTDDVGDMQLVRADTGASVTVAIPCDAMVPTSVSLSAGDYEIFVTGDGSDSQIPALRTSLGVHSITVSRALTLNVDAFAVSIRLTLNGAPYALISACTGTDDAGDYALSRTDTGATFNLAVPCDSAVPAEAWLPAGDYEISVTGDGSDTEIPALRTSLGVHTIAATANLSLNVDSVEIRASITLNGAPFVLISACTGTDDAGSIDFVRSNGASLNVKIPCDSSVPAVAFLSGGTYEIFVTGDGSDTEIPALRTSVGTRNLTASSSIVLNVDAVTIDLSLTLNGAPYALISACTGTDDAGEYNFVRTDTGATMTIKIPCEASTPAQVSLPTGEYEVFMTGDGSDTRLPAIRTSLGRHTFTTSGGVTLNVDAVDVSVLLTLNSAPYVLISACTGTDDAGEMSFVNEITGATLTAKIPCDAMVATQVYLPSGPYEVFVTGDGSDTQIPALRTRVARLRI